MKWPRIIDDSKELLQITAEKALESPKTTMAVSAYSFVAGLSAFLDWFAQALPTLAIFAGFVGAVVLAHMNWKKRILAEIEAENAKLRGRILREQMRQMNIETREDHQT